MIGHDGFRYIISIALIFISPPLPLSRCKINQFCACNCDILRKKKKWSSFLLDFAPPSLISCVCVCVCELNKKKTLLHL